MKKKIAFLKVIYKFLKDIANNKEKIYCKVVVSYRPQPQHSGTKRQQMKLSKNWHLGKGFLKFKSKRLANMYKRSGSQFFRTTTTGM